MPHFENCDGGATEELVQEFEGHLGVKLPGDYRQYLLSHNGCSPDPYKFRVPGWGESLVNELYGLGFDDYRSMDRAIERRVDLFIRTETIPIGSDPGGNGILMGVARHNFGIVYFFDHEDSDQELFEVAPSFGHFIEHLFESP